MSDQRGLQRVTDGTLILDPEQKNSCEIGSVELMRMTAADIVNLKNVSHVTLFDSYQQEIDRLKALVQAPEKIKSWWPNIRQICKTMKIYLNFPSKTEVSDYLYRSICTGPQA